LKHKELKEPKPCLVVSNGTGSQASGSNRIIRKIKQHILKERLQDKIRLRITGDIGFCQMNPVIVTEPGMNFYPKVKGECLPRIIDAALKGEVAEDLLYKETTGSQVYRFMEDIPFFKKQNRNILRENQRIDPIRILSYIENGGYAAFEHVMANLDPEWTIEEIKRSGLRGRGGAGFPTGKKWELARHAGTRASQKFVVCNADEGDPGAYMDRGLLEGNPHAIIEGLLIAGVAIGATHGFVYVRAEYPLAIKHVMIAIRQARELGVLGTNILDTGIDFDLEMVRGAGAFVCGEETALIRSIEGKIGEPRQRPPFPIEKGIGGHPTCINNVETLANIPLIINKAAEEYAKIGVPGNTGTKIFSLVGKVKNTGLIEVPLGTRLKEVVYDIGGGPVGKAKIKAVQTGGPSGGCIPADMFDLPIDYESLKEAGSIMGSGGMIVMDENTCMVDVAKYFMGFLKDESCGKCFTCRKGTQRMYELLDDITSGRGTLANLDLLEELAQVVRDTTLCGLGQTAANPVLSTLRYFRHEYENHIVHKRCEAFVCKELVGAPCQTACPLGTEVWRYVAHIRRGEYEAAYRVIREANPFPSVCARVCHHPCEARCRLGTSGGDPIAIRALKRFITDRVDPRTYRGLRLGNTGADATKVAVVGAGPAGLSTAHYLSLRGYRVTVFEREAQPGGMLTSCIPSYRLPRDVVNKEIMALLNENVTMKLNTTLGRDLTIDGLFDDGFRAVFLAMGSDESRRLNIEGEDSEHVYTGMQFLKAFNLHGVELAKRRVGVVGGGNSAVDAARVALRQRNADSVTIFYRRSRQEMPAFEEEVEAALEEGIRLETLVSPTRIHCTDGRLTALECIRNKLGDLDASGRRKAFSIAGTEKTFPVDTLIVAVGEEPRTDFLAAAGVEIGTKRGVFTDTETLLTTRQGVFAGGDVVTGSNTVVAAIAAGRKAAGVIDRYLKGQELRQPGRPQVPTVYVKPVEPTAIAPDQAGRVEPPMASIESRRRTFAEVENTISEENARREAGRCLRCDLEFTQVTQEETHSLATGRQKA
jgi:NADH-quinone oxidoreductase subunit F